MFFYRFLLSVYESKALFDRPLVVRQLLNYTVLLVDIKKPSNFSFGLIAIWAILICSQQHISAHDGSGRS